MNTIAEKVKEIIATELALREEKDEVAVLSSDSFVEDLGCADPFDKVELVLAFEEAFNIHIPDQDAERMMAKTVQHAINCVSRLAANRSQLGIPLGARH
jgi:acyl carrier protein